MKKHLLEFSVLSLLFAVLAMPCAATVKKKAGGRNISTFSTRSVPTNMVKCLFAMCDAEAAGVAEGIADYYMVFTDREDALYDKYQGAKVNDGYVLTLDLYGEVSNPIALQEGTYKPYKAGDYTAFTYDADYSYLQAYDVNGNETSDYSLVGDIVVSKSAAGYKITANVSVGGTVQIITYDGALKFDDASASPTIFAQIKSDLDLKLNGALANYDGNLYNSNTGAMYINLYDGEFNPETGGMTGNGFSLALQVFGKLFNDSKNATLDPGTYTMARNFNRYTWYPGIEIEYMGMVGLMGSYAKERNDLKYGSDSPLAYSYLSDGTIEIEDLGNSVFKITVDAVTVDGYTVKGVFEGTVPVNDKSDDNSKGSIISTLEDDVDLDLDQIPMAYIWNTGVVNDCQTFLVDVGSPAGRDNITEGDIIRLEFVCPVGTQYVNDGTYTVMENKHESYYAPFTMGRGRFAATSGGGSDLTGTRYMHFIEGRNLIMDHYAPAAFGTTGVQKNADGTYTFNIALMCDAQFNINGSWTGPVTLMYDPSNISAIDCVEADPDAVRVEWLDRSTLLVSGVVSAENAVLYSATGVRMIVPVSGCLIDMSSLASGIYILNLNGKSIKIAKR